MNYNILKEYEGKSVDVFTVRSTFSGTLKLDIQKHLAILVPDDAWTTKRYGSTVVDLNHVVAIREVLPRPVSEKDEGEDDCESCDTDKKSERKG